MDKLDSYKVDLKGMSTDTVSYQWQVNDDFFSAVQGQEIQQGLLSVALRVKRASDVYEMNFQFEGEVKVLCDRCLELMDLPISAECRLQVRLGDQFEDDGDVVTVPYEEGVFNVAWNLYEMIALEIPIRHVHAECKSYASDFAMEEGNAEDAPVATDPRWNELRKILDNNKNIKENGTS